MRAPRFLSLVAVVALAATGVARAAENNPSRFTQALAAAERTESGISRLTSDQVAVLDALVRRDLATRSSAAAEPKTPVPPFSQRLTADERRLAGFGVLTTAEIARLDTLVEKRAKSDLVRTLLAPPTYLQRAPVVQPVERDDRRKIHGSYSLSYGWGKGGYSERTGAMMMNYDDPDGRYSISIGYSESHAKVPEGQSVYLEGPPYRP